MRNRKIKLAGSLFIGCMFVFTVINTLSPSVNSQSNNVTLASILVMNYANAEDSDETKCYNIDSYDCYDGYEDGISRCLHNSEYDNDSNCGE